MLLLVVFDLRFSFGLQLGADDGDGDVGGVHVQHQQSVLFSTIFS